MENAIIVSLAGAAIFAGLGIKSIVKYRKQKLKDYFAKNSTSTGLRNSEKAGADTSDVRAGLRAIQSNVDINMEFVKEYGSDVGLWPMDATLEYIQRIEKGVK